MLKFFPRIELHPESPNGAYVCRRFSPDQRFTLYNLGGGGDSIQHGQRFPGVVHGVLQKGAPPRPGASGSIYHDPDLPGVIPGDERRPFRKHDLGISDRPLLYLSC